MKDKDVEFVKLDLIEMNKKFHDKLILNEAFYEQLRQNGFVFSKCFLISIFPDSGKTYCGKIIRQDGSAFEFDVDLDSPEYSSWENVTDSFQKLYEKNKIEKPWLEEVVACKLFNEMEV